MTSSSKSPLAGTAPGVRVINPQGCAPLLLICDHASNAIPPDYENLGLDSADLNRHIAFDVGAAFVTERLAWLLDAPALLHGASRLLIDPNRTLDDPTSICAISDGTVVPGNRTITPSERTERIERYFEPYHQAIDTALEGFAERGISVPVMAVHSYSPVYKGAIRPWEIGFLWMRENPFSRGLIDAFARRGDCQVGDNQPYDARNGHGYTIETHIEPRGLPNALIELRNDLIETDAGATLWADRLAAATSEVLSIPLAADDRVA